MIEVVQVVVRGEDMRVCQKKAAAGCQKEIAAAAKHRGVGVVEVQVVDINMVGI